tara:strand:+ start:439 stop:639 length:201 start_codon:yes stop_codon:yes gene_type:complete
MITLFAEAFTQRYGQDFEEQMPELRQVYMDGWQDALNAAHNQMYYILDELELHRAVTQKEQDDEYL